MYLLTIRDGLQTRHIGPYESPAHAVEDLDALLGPDAERARWQIHELEAPVSSGFNQGVTCGPTERGTTTSAVAA